MQKNMKILFIPFLLIIGVYSYFLLLPAQSRTIALKPLKDKYTKLDPVRKKVQRYAGEGVAIRTSRGRSEPDFIAKDFITTYKEELGVDVDKIKIKHVHKGKKLQRIIYQQMYHGIPVSDSFVTVAMRNNKVVLFNSSYQTLPSNLEIHPRVKELEARDIVKERFNINGLIDYLRLSISKTSSGFTLAHELLTPTFEENGELARYLVKVDAIDGTIISIVSDIEYQVQGSVTGPVYPSFSNDPQVQLPFKSEWVTVNDIQLTTSEDGSYSSIDVISPFYIESTLEGPWASVTNLQQPEASNSFIPNSGLVI